VDELKAVSNQGTFAHLTRFLNCLDTCIRITKAVSVVPSTLHDMQKNCKFTANLNMSIHQAKNFLVTKGGFVVNIDFKRRN
jgi:hypothetical protein